MQRKHWLGHAADLHLVGCRGQMAAECVAGVIVVCTPIACMHAGMHVRQRVAALGIVFSAFVFCNTPELTTFMQQDAMLPFVIAKKIFGSWSCVRCSRIHRGGLRQRRGL